MASKKAENKATKAADAGDGKVDVHQISATKLKKVVSECINISVECGERSAVSNELKRAAKEQGMDVQALGLLIRLKKKGLANPYTLGSILRSFDFGRDVLGLDAMVPADFWEAPTEGKKTHRKKVATEHADDGVEVDDTAHEAPVENIEHFEEHLAA